MPKTNILRTIIQIQVSICEKIIHKSTLRSTNDVILKTVNLRQIV